MESFTFIGIFYYIQTNLLSTPVVSTQKEHLAEDNVNKLFRLIEIIAENQEPLEITKDLVEIAFKKTEKEKS